MGIKIQNAKIVTLYYYSENEQEWVFDMSCRVVEGMIHHSILNEMQALNNNEIKTKLIYG